MKIRRRDGWFRPLLKLDGKILTSYGKSIAEPSNAFWEKPTVDELENAEALLSLQGFESPSLGKKPVRLPKLKFLSATYHDLPGIFPLEMSLKTLNMAVSCEKKRRSGWLGRKEQKGAALFVDWWYSIQKTKTDPWWHVCYAPPFKFSAIPADDKFADFLQKNHSAEWRLAAGVAASRGVCFRTSPEVAVALAEILPSELVPWGKRVWEQHTGEPFCAAVFFCLPKVQEYCGGTWKAAEMIYKKFESLVSVRLLNGNF